MAKSPRESTQESNFSDEEIARRYETTLKRVLTTPPQHKTAKGEKANPPKKRGRPKKASPA
jgi:hypothetical protein